MSSHGWSTRYAAVNTEEAIDPASNEKQGLRYSATRDTSTEALHWSVHLTRVLLGLSLVFNVFLGIALHNVARDDAAKDESAKSLDSIALSKSPYAGLEFNVNSTWESETPYAQENVTAADLEWEAIDISNAFVALTKAEAQDMGLPRSLPFPWDRQKELYLISSIHSMHCLTVLHRSNLEYRTGHTQTYSTEHILHCLDNLRVDIQCAADDTPRFIPPHARESTAKTGVGQIRQCRDWSQLNAWAEEHDACFRYNQFLRLELEHNKVWPLAWQFCKKDSESITKVQKYLHKGSDWVSPDPEWPNIDEIRN